MRAVVQRASSASVAVDGQTVSRIGPGMVLLLGIGRDDTCDDIPALVDKVVNLRIFEDEEGKMNRSLLEVAGEALVVSQFTLYGDCRKGRRPGFTDAAPPDQAEGIYRAFVEQMRRCGVPVSTGVFQAHMVLTLNNDGPVTLLLDSKKHF